LEFHFFLFPLTPGGVVFHVLNRANAHARIFGKDTEYAAFERVMKETLAKREFSKADADSGLPDAT
jgi:hypothetical protein